MNCVLRYGMYTVRDMRSGLYTCPAFYENNEVAERSFRILCTTPGTLVSSCPSDFSMYFIGEFEPMSGMIYPSDKDILIAFGSDYVKRGVDDVSDDVL